MEGVMGAILTYHLRTGIISAVAGGELFHLPAQQDPSRVAVWEHQYEFRPGQYTLWDHTFVPPHAHNRVETPTVGRAARQLSCKIAGHRASHAHFGPAIFIGDARVGFFIHGWPPCNLRRCVVIMHGLEVLFNALAGEDRLSFCVEY
jgi:hypothetical protein